MKLTKHILEAVNKGIQLALDDYEDINDNNIMTPIINGSKNDVIEHMFLNAIKSNNFNALNPQIIKIIHNDFEHYLSLINLSLEDYYIIRYMYDNKLIGYLDDILLKKYEKNKVLFETKYRKVRSKTALQNIIREEIKEKGPNCDLNWIDTSDITDMRMLFYDLDARVVKNDILATFAGDISKWDVSNVTNMEQMFQRCKNFNSDISNWDVSNVKNFSAMFWGASKFNQDLSKWNVSNGAVFSGMFLQATSFNQDLSKWNVNLQADTRYMFDRCPINPEYKPKNINENTVEK